MISSLIVSSTVEHSHLFAANTPGLDLAAGFFIVSGISSLFAGIRLLFSLPATRFEDFMMKRR